MSRGYYSTAQVCLNGHPIASDIDYNPVVGKKFCDECGESTLTNCQECNAKIRGAYHVPGVVHLGFTYTPPSFCPECGKAFPWIRTRLEAAKELTDELQGVTQEEKDILKGSLDDIIRDTPKTTVAATRFKRIVAKGGKEIGGAFKDILVNIIAEAAKKIIWP